MRTKRKPGGKTNRNNPRNAASSDATTTVFDFERRYPNDAACLEELVKMLYPNGIYCPKCRKVTKHHRMNGRPAYECQFCGHMEYPMKGTIFQGSSTSLKLWFYGIFLMASTRCGISAKQLERETGVSYPTALRMFRQIRTLLGPPETSTSFSSLGATSNDERSKEASEGLICNCYTGYPFGCYPATVCSDTQGCEVQNFGCGYYYADPCDGRCNWG